jgi:2-octaprenyl-6-methoxyphenol hydroxylase
VSATPAPAPTEVDVAIVGGGMVGASLALALAGTALRTLLIESVAFGSEGQPSFDERTTALGNASRRIFASLGIWEQVAPEAGAIRSIHVSDAGRFGFARLDAAEQGIEAFGYVVANRALGAALWARLEGVPQLTVRAPARLSGLDIDAVGVRLALTGPGGVSEAYTARLVVAADGAHSQVREAAGIGADTEDYGQVALVTTLASDTPHGERAFERFTPHGPLAVLPLHNGSLAVIWACTPAGRRASYPLRLSRANAPVAARTVLIGNASQALHPVAGQGFNLGLRDAAMLAEVLAQERGDIGAPQVLERFAAWRAQDRAGVVRFTDGLVRLFGDTRPGVGALRNLGLLLFDLAPPAKSALARVSAGFGGPSPRLARGLPVRHG